MYPKNLLQDLFQSYFDARKNKRSTHNQLAFEINYEQEIFSLYEDLKNEKYKIGSSICFISFHPVQREIFAGDFRDRVVHHLIYNYVSSFFERQFIHDSYSCRIGKGTSYGIRRIDHFIRSCSRNYSRDCYILKLDLSGYFMSIDHSILFGKIKTVFYRSPLSAGKIWGGGGNSRLILIGYCDLFIKLFFMTRPKIAI